MKRTGGIENAVAGSGRLGNRVATQGQVDRLNTQGAPMDRSEINSYFQTGRRIVRQKERPKR